MALIDTGLGWSADEDWVGQSNGMLGKINIIGGPSFPNQPFPVTTNQATDLVNNGFLAVSYKSSSSGNPTQRYFYGSETGSNKTFAFHVGTVLYVMSNVRYAKYYYVWRSNNSTVGGPYTKECNLWSGVSGVYYSSGSSFSGSDYVWNCPEFASVDDAAAALMSSISCNKLNVGYAVRSFIKWKSSPTSYNMSAVLISSDSSYCVLSEDGNTQSSRYYSREVSFSGIRFTIGLITVPGEDAAISQSTVLYRDLSENIYRSIDELFRAVARLSSLTVTQTVDPYSPVGPSEEDVGDGDFDETDDEIPMSSLPSLSFASTGFCRVYSPTLAQLSALATYMWTDQTFLQTLANHIIQLLEDPMEAIISLSLVPCSPTVGPAESVKVLFISIPDVSMYPVTNQFTDVECGTLAVNEYYGSALDYNPYTKISCFLPFIGMVELDTDEVMGKTLSITYRIDVVSGACTAIIKADGDVYYQFSGHCSVQMPVTSADFSEYVSAIMSTAKLVAGLGASAAGAPALGGALLGAPPIGSKSTTQTTTSGGEVTLTKRNPETGRQVISGRVTTAPQTKETVHTPGGMNFGELAIRSTANTVGAVMNSKAGIQHSGGFSGISGYLGVRYPYLIIKRPRLCNPSQYGQYNGRPSMIYANLGDCTGYTEVQSIQLTGIPATNPEMSEIAELLKSGVIL